MIPIPVLSRIFRLHGSDSRSISSPNLQCTVMDSSSTGLRPKKVGTRKCRARVTGRKISRNRTELKTMSPRLASEESNPARQGRFASSPGHRGDGSSEPAPSSAFLPLVLAVVATAEVLLQPDVQADEEIAAPHL